MGSVMTLLSDVLLTDSIRELNRRILSADSPPPLDLDRLLEILDLYVRGRYSRAKFLLARDWLFRPFPN